MVKIVVRGEETEPEQVLELWLEESVLTPGGAVILKGQLRNKERGPYTLLCFRPDGSIFKSIGISSTLGLNLDANERLRFTN